MKLAIKYQIDRLVSARSILTGVILEIENMQPNEMLIWTPDEILMLDVIRDLAESAKHLLEQDPVKKITQRDQEE